jgi:VIT1/CCC1 family predicted Fe2+/Mn2+ transporter
MRHSFKVGLSFGLTSGVITTLGLIVGLHSSTHSKLVIVGGILVIAVADALSDAMGVHVSEESENRHSTREIWESTIATFSCKLVFALSFIAPILLFRLPVAVVVCVIWGLSLLTVFSLYLGRQHGASPYKVVLEHLCIAVLVIIVTHWVGDWVARFTS